MSKYPQTLYLAINQLKKKNKELKDECERLGKIIHESGGCMVCGDSDPYRVGKWGMSNKEVYQDTTTSLRFARDFYKQALRDLLCDCAIESSYKKYHVVQIACAAWDAAKDAAQKDIV